MDTDRSTRLAWLTDKTWVDEPPPPRYTLETLLAFHAPKRSSTQIMLAITNQHRRPVAALHARLATQTALANRGQHPRQSLPR